MKKDFIIPAAVFACGLAAGVAIVITDKWGWFEPVIGMATLAAAAGGWIRSILIERKLGSVMEQKSFQITFGLRAGYEGEGADYSLNDALKLVGQWMSARVSRGLPILTGMVSDTTLVYPVRNAADGSRVTKELSGVFSGSLSPRYDKGRSDREVTDTLNDLAMFLGRGLCQKRVYVSFAGKQWALDI